MGMAITKSALAGSAPLAGAMQPPLAAVECPLKGAGAMRDRRFTAWRGRSGRRYIASVFPITDATALGYADAVLMAVSADRRILAARDSGPFGLEGALLRWRDAVREAGAVELHLHLLAEDETARDAALRDLTPVLAS